MTTIKKSAWLPYTPAQMFDLVNAIEDYPAFLPWCKSTVVHSRNEDEIRAKIVVAKKGIEQAFTTINRLQKNKMIEVRLLEGPFRHLEGFWLFEAVETGCRVSLDLEFEFSNKLISLTVGPILQKATESFIEAFSNRAISVYGPGNHQR